MLGAWFAEEVPQQAAVLDIGSGTGLLMMMVAQKTKGQIHGIELHPACFRQLQNNISRCQWKERLLAFSGDARSFSFPIKYDFIISNPPFFDNDLPSIREEDQVAMHSSKLSFEELTEIIDKNLSLHGAFGVLVPYDRWEYFNTLSKRRHLWLRAKLFIKHSPAHHFSRAILHYTRQNVDDVAESNITIRTSSGEYTSQFISLLKDYYLYL
jgi:tRNA1Val (adenine37-N6)-methyltransferase